MGFRSYVRHFRVQFLLFSVLHCHGVFPSGGVFWAAAAAAAAQQQQQQEQKQQEQEQPQGTVATVKSSFFMGFRSYVRHFLGAILMLPRPSLPWCFPIREVFFEQKQQQREQHSPGSAAGAAALIRPGARGARSWPCPCRTAVLSSPKERGRGRRPCRRPPRTIKKLPRFTVFFAVPIFSHFSEFVAEDGSTWANIGRKMGQKMGQQRPT